jgi:benzoylformate decarboxylase
MSAQPAGVFRTVSSTVHEATYEVLRSLGVTPIFGNPGSNELPFINQLPSDFRYILALHEGAGLAIADGYSQSHGHAYTSGCMQID